MLNLEDEKIKKGYVRFFRSFIEWEWFTDINVCHLFQYCILRANHSDTEWRGIEIKRGSFITSLENLAISTGLSIQQIRTAIKKLKITNEITYKTTSQYSIISVNNYDLYQNDNMQNNNQITNNQQTNNKQSTTDNNEIIMNNNEIIMNNNKEKNKKFIIPSVQQIEEYCTERKNNVNAHQFYDYYSSRGWFVGKNRMKDWKAAVRTWEYNQINSSIQNNKNEGEYNGYNFVS